jgi:hypothetical protein
MLHRFIGAPPPLIRAILRNIFLLYAHYYENILSMRALLGGRFFNMHPLLRSRFEYARILGREFLI